MATTQEIAELRLAIKEPNNVEPYTDEFLGGLIDAYGVNASAGKVWRSKAASVSNLVDISEGGSTRKLSQVFDQYTKNAIGFETADSETIVPAYTAPRSRKAERV